MGSICCHLKESRSIQNSPKSFLLKQKTFKVEIDEEINLNEIVNNKDNANNEFIYEGENLSDESIITYSNLNSTFNSFKKSKQTTLENIQPSNSPEESSPNMKEAIIEFVPIVELEKEIKRKQNCLGIELTKCADTIGEKLLSLTASISISDKTTGISSFFSEEMKIPSNIEIMRPQLSVEQVTFILNILSDINWVNEELDKDILYYIFLILF